MIEKRNVAAGFNVKLQEDPYLPTDVTAFYPKHIPVMEVFTGATRTITAPPTTPTSSTTTAWNGSRSSPTGIVHDWPKTNVPSTPWWNEAERIARRECSHLPGDDPRLLHGDMEGVKLRAFAAAGPPKRRG